MSGISPKRKKKEAINQYEAQSTSVQPITHSIQNQQKLRKLANLEGSVRRAGDKGAITSKDSIVYLYNQGCPKYIPF
jgi:hypothetical protein